MRFQHSPLRTPNQDAAFALRDLIAAGAAAVVLLGLTAASSGADRVRSQVATCLNNHRQLAVALRMYADDYSGTLPGNYDGGSHSTNQTWCAGWLENEAYVADNTNWALMMNSQLGPYTRTPTIYKCPADTSLSRGRTGIPRVRSVSMNGYMGKLSLGRPYTPGYRNFLKYSDIADPTPARAFVFIDEREDSLNDAVFTVDMSSWSPSDPSGHILVDFPADWHNRGATLSFADGHAESWTWQDPRTMPAHRIGGQLPLGQLAPTNTDLVRIQAATSSRAIP